MSQKDSATQIGNAWALHRQNKNENAISEFSQALKQDPNNIDALYGLGLAQRSAGLRDAARKTFQDCKAQVDRALQQNPGEDRFEILERMCRQRLAELDALR